MAKFHGTVGYAETVETKPGVWEPRIIKRSYYGELLRNNRRLESSSNSTNDNINIANEVSIVADPYARDNFHNMKYIQFMGTKWKVTMVEPQYPRLILTIGGVYNGKD